VKCKFYEETCTLNIRNLNAWIYSDDTHDESVVPLGSTYIGLPLSMSKISRTMLPPVIQRVDSRLPGWMPRMLGSGAQVQLINSALSAIPNFSMACILWDKASIEAIDRLTRAFLWKNKKDIHGGHCLIAWDVVTMPKEQGGLG
jgi:hypothetical protein